MKVCVEKNQPEARNTLQKTKMLSKWRKVTYCEYIVSKRNAMVVEVPMT